MDEFRRRRERCLSAPNPRGWAVCWSLNRCRSPWDGSSSKRRAFCWSRGTDGTVSIGDQNFRRFLSGYLKNTYIILINAYRTAQRPGGQDFRVNWMERKCPDRSVVSFNLRNQFHVRYLEYWDASISVGGRHFAGRSETQ